MPLKSFIKNLSLLSLVFLIGFILYMWFEVYDPFILDKITLKRLGEMEVVLFGLEVICFSLVIYYSYSLWKFHVPFAKMFWNLELLSHFLVYTFLLIAVVFVIPGLYYLNGLMLFSGIYATNASELLQVNPGMKFSDFWALCMESNSGKAESPSLGGHIAVAGVHEGKNYVCVDVVQAINKTLQESNVARYGAYGVKAVFKVPDIVCSGITPSDLSPKGGGPKS